MCQCRFIIVTNTTLVAGADSGEGLGGVTGRGIWELFVLSAQFCCEPKPALRNEVSFKKKKKKSGGTREWLAHVCPGIMFHGFSYYVQVVFPQVVRCSGLLIVFPILFPQHH